jgi:hypothetical protein
MKSRLTHKELLDYCTYNQDTGIFAKNNARKTRVGYYDSGLNQRIISINGVKLRETRVAFFYVNEYWPIGNLQNRSRTKHSVTKYKDLDYIKKGNVIVSVFPVNPSPLSCDSSKPKKQSYFQRFLNMFGRL